MSSKVPTELLTGRRELAKALAVKAKEHNPDSLYGAQARAVAVLFSLSKAGAVLWLQGKGSASLEKYRKAMKSGGVPSGLDLSVFLTHQDRKGVLKEASKAPPPPQPKASKRGRPRRMVKGPVSAEVGSAASSSSPSFKLILIGRHDGGGYLVPGESLGAPEFRPGVGIVFPVTDGIHPVIGMRQGGKLTFENLPPNLDGFELGRGQDGEITFVMKKRR